MTKYGEKRETMEALKKAYIVLSTDREYKDLKEMYNILLYRRDCVAEYAGDKSKRPHEKYLAEQWDDITQVMNLIEKKIYDIKRDDEEITNKARKELFKNLFVRFMVAYKETFLGDVKARKATLDMINLASAVFKLYMVDLINENDMSKIRYYYHYIGTCAEAYGLEDLWTGEVL